MTGLPFSVILQSSVSDYSLFCSTCCSSYSIMFCTGIILHISRLIMMIVIIKSQNQVLHSYWYQRLPDDVSQQNLYLLWIPRYWIQTVKLWSSTCCTAISGFKMICFSVNFVPCVFSYSDVKLTVASSFISCLLVAISRSEKNSYHFSLSFSAILT